MVIQDSRLLLCVLRGEAIETRSYSWMKLMATLLSALPHLLHSRFYDTIYSQL